MNNCKQNRTDTQITENTQLVARGVGGEKEKTNKNNQWRSSPHGSVVRNPTIIYEDAGLTPGLAQWVKDPALP